MNDPFLQVLLVAIPVLLPPLIGVIVVFVKAQIAKLPPNARDFVQQVVSTAVLTVEQTASDQLNNVGKKQLAIKTVMEELAHWKTSVPESIVSNLIEEAVSFLPPTNPQGRLAPVPSSVVVLDKTGTVQA